MASEGKLYVFEGPDGTGKTTISRFFAEALQARGLSVKWVAFPGCELGTLGKFVYDLHHAVGEFRIEKMNSTSLQLLHVAAHVDVIQRAIIPALRAGTSIVLDRFWWSTLVYGTTYGADLESLRKMMDLERDHWRGFEPAAVFLMQTPRPFTATGIAEWTTLVAEYAKLADEESRTRNVHLILNTREMAETLRACLTAVGLIDSSKKPIHQKRLSTSPSSAGKERSAPKALAKLAPLRPTIVYDTYWRFAAERQAIFFKRLRGQQQPWTQDDILCEYKFTNAYRASDRVSQYLIRRVIYEGDQSIEETFFRILLFKIFNRIETWELLQDKLGVVTYADYSFQRYENVLGRAIGDGERIYSAAYIMPTGGARNGSGRKHRMHLRLLETMMREELPARVSEADSMARVFDLLLSYPTIGGFLAYQYASDLNYSTITDFPETQFVVPGPGARDGIRKCFEDTGGLTDAEVIKVVAERQESEFERLGLRFENLWGRKLQLIDCQNLFCEVDKYARVRHPEIAGLTGRTRIKQRYRNGNKEPIRFWYPPKWGINDLVAKEMMRVPELLWADGR